MSLGQVILFTWLCGVSSQMDALQWVLTWETGSFDSHLVLRPIHMPSPTALSLLLTSLLLGPHYPSFHQRG